MLNISAWPLKRLLALGFAVVMVTLLAVAAAGLAGQRHALTAMQTIFYDRTEPLADLGRIHYLEARNRIILQDAAGRGDTAHAAKRMKEFDANLAEAASRWKTYMATRLTPEESDSAKRLEQVMQSYHARATYPTAAALREGRFDDAKELLTKQVSPLNPPVVEAMDALIGLQVRVAKEEFEQSEATAARLDAVSVAATVFGILLGTLVVVGTLRSVTQRLGADPAALAQAVNRFAEGDLAPVAGADRAPPGSVLAAMGAMQGKLASIVGQVRSGSDSIATASSQIAQGNLDLSSRTEEQASSLQQTAASMEQLGSTVRQNADNARQANQLALGASEIAAKGGAVVAQVVDTMKGINDSSRQIADIISVIDGIAFQTNILALNAAVEAARAGEQGRGFAVVASEVRSLAQRSAQAAKEIKGLIGASVARVDSGTALVDQAGATMQQIVSSIGRVTDIMGEIASASLEQSNGVSQVGVAVTQMDKVTQENAALVEESAAAAESLKAQAQALVQAVSVFKLTQHDELARAGNATSRGPSATVRVTPDQSSPTRRVPASAGRMTAAHVPVSSPKLSALSATPAENEWAAF